MRYLLVAVSLLLGSLTSAGAQVSVGVSIGINVPVFPELVPVPGYPVYYAPQADFNYFFYDGMYWVYQDDSWYAATWYNGPWQVVRPESVPAFVLRVPVRYYRQPPPYFRGWREDGPPRWGERWGPGWERRRAGWDHWDRRSAPRPAPLPVYQRQYSGNRYPRAVEQQRSIRSEHYQYRPREAVAREHFQPRNTGGPRGEPQRRGPGPQSQGPGPQRQGPGAQRQGPGAPRQGPGPQRQGPGEPRQGPSPQWQRPGPQQQQERGPARGQPQPRGGGRPEEHGRGER